MEAEILTLVGLVTQAGVANVILRSSPSVTEMLKSDLLKAVLAVSRVKALVMVVEVVSFRRIANVEVSLEPSVPPTVATP